MVREQAVVPIYAPCIPGRAVQVVQPFQPLKQVMHTIMINMTPKIVSLLSMKIKAS